jgi:hypothetical protein
MMIETVAGKKKLKKRAANPAQLFNIFRILVSYRY